MQNNLRALMKEKGVKTRDLANELGYTVGMISHYKTGKTYPYVDIACKIARYLGVKVEDIWTLD